MQHGHILLKSMKGNNKGLTQADNDVKQWGQLFLISVPTLKDFYFADQPTNLEFS